MKSITQIFNFYMIFSVLLSGCVGGTRISIHKNYPSRKTAVNTPSENLPPSNPLPLPPSKQRLGVVETPASSLHLLDETGKSVGSPLAFPKRSEIQITKFSNDLLAYMSEGNNIYSYKFLPTLDWSETEVQLATLSKSAVIFLAGKSVFGVTADKGNKIFQFNADPVVDMKASSQNFALLTLTHNAEIRNATTGQKIWDTRGDGSATDPAIQNSVVDLAISDNRVLLLTRTHNAYLRSVANGAPLWKTDSRAFFNFGAKNPYPYLQDQIRSVAQSNRQFVLTTHSGRAYVFQGDVIKPGERPEGSLLWDSPILDGHIVNSDVSDTAVVFVTDQGNAYLHDGRTGNVLWNTIQNPLPNEEGQKSEITTAFVSGDWVVFLTTHSNAYVRRINDGSPEWDSSQIPELAQKIKGVSIFGHTIVFRTGDSTPGIYHLRVRNTGTRIDNAWNTLAPRNHLTGRILDNPQNSNQETILLIQKNAFVQNTTDGTPLWGSDSLGSDFQSHIQSAIGTNESVVLLNDAGTVSVRDSRNGNERWSTHLDRDQIFKVVGSGSQIFFLSQDGRVMARDEKTGQLIWGTPSPLQKDELPFEKPYLDITASSKHVVLLTKDHTLLVRKCEDGTTLWSSPLSLHQNIATVSTSDQYIVVITQTHDAFVLDSHQGKIVWHTENGRIGNVMGLGDLKLRGHILDAAISDLHVVLLVKSDDGGVNAFVRSVEDGSAILDTSTQGAPLQDRIAGVSVTHSHIHFRTRGSDLAVADGYGRGIWRSSEPSLLGISGEILDFSVNSRQFTVLTQEGSLYLYETTQTDQGPVLDGKKPILIGNNISAVEMSGQRILALTQQNNCNIYNTEGRLLWHTNTQRLNSLKGHVVDFKGAENYIAFRTDQNQVHIFDSSGKPIWNTLQGLPSSPGRVVDLALSNQALLLVIETLEETLGETLGESVGNPPTGSIQKLPNESLELSKANELTSHLLPKTHRNISVINFANRTQWHSQGSIFSNRVKTAQLSHSHIAVLTQDNTLTLFNPSTGDVLWKSDLLPDVHGHITSFKISNRNLMIQTDGLNAITPGLFILDVHTGKEVWNSIRAQMSNISTYNLTVGLDFDR